MAHFNLQPPGVLPLNNSGRKPIIPVVSGDTWSLSANLYHPDAPQTAATPETTFATVILAETQFDAPLWTGEWYSGIYPDARRSDLAHIRIPLDVTRALRRGSYRFSIRVSDLLKTRFATELEGSFLVEYKPTSEQHSIPYKDPSANAGYEDADATAYPHGKEVCT